MAISFLTSTNIEVDVFLTFDPSVQITEDQRSAYLTTGVMEGEVKEDATRFTIKALSPSDREEAEVRAGSYTRSELGRMLWIEAPSDHSERARWHHDLNDDERSAMSQYQAYLNRVYLEMLRGGLTHINGEEASVEQVDMIRPDSDRLTVISELVAHIQRISLLGVEGK